MFSLCNLLNILLKLIELVKIVVKPIKQKNIKLKAIISLLIIFPVKISGFKVRIKIENNIVVKNISYFWIEDKFK